MPITLALVGAALAATGPANNGRAARPPMGWRTWNQWQGAIHQSIIESNMRMLADRSRTIDGRHQSLADIGYNDAGLDDGWQKCGRYGPNSYRYHDASGAPVVDLQEFPDMRHMTRLATSLNLTAGWYGNACGCVDGCCSDHCDSIECFAGDVNATLALGFASYKIDGCGAQRDIDLWAALFNHSALVHGLQRGVMIENCHDGDGASPGANAPYYTADGGLWCPFHMYRTSGDARPTFGSLLGNLNSTRALALANLSLPGCWAYADMLELGVTNIQGRHDCGATGREECRPLAVHEARSHFGAWCVVSSPLVLSFDLADAAELERHWETITNTDAIAVNQDYAGHSGTQFAESESFVNFYACDWQPQTTPCEWPAWTAWYKPLTGTDARGSTMAILLIMNNANKMASLSFEWASVPGLGGNVTSCAVYDVWRRLSLGTHTGSGYVAPSVAARDSAFLTLSACTYTA